MFQQRSELTVEQQAALALAVAAQAAAELQQRVSALANQAPSALRFVAAMQAARAIAEYLFSEDLPMDASCAWIRNFLLLTGQHCILTEDGWINGAAKAELLAAEPGLPILDELNAAPPADTPPPAAQREPGTREASGIESVPPLEATRRVCRSMSRAMQAHVRQNPPERREWIERIWIGAAVSLAASLGEKIEAAGERIDIHALRLAGEEMFAVIAKYFPAVGNETQTVLTMPDEQN